MESALASPYERALGSRMRLLHPVLQQYFSTIPPGAVGVGVGVFDEFGTPHHWLGPALALLRHRSVVIPGTYRDVPFRVENRTVDGRAVAARTLDLEAGTWTMRDSVYLAPGGRVVDTIGRPALVDANFDIEVREGALHLNSDALAVRLGRCRIRLPRLLAPRVELSERYDDADHRQHIALTVRVPLLGVVYAYRGAFTYRIEGD